MPDKEEPQIFSLEDATIEQLYDEIARRTKMSALVFYGAPGAEESKTTRCLSPDDSSYHEVIGILHSGLLIEEFQFNKDMFKIHVDDDEDEEDDAL